MQQILTLSKFYFSSFTGLNRDCWRGIVISLFESTFIMGVYYFLSIYFTRELRFSINHAAMIISCYGLGAILGGLLGGKLSDKFLPETVSAASMAIQACGYLSLIKLTAMPFLMADLFIVGIATYSFITANYLSVLNRCKHDEAQRLKAINFLSIASNLGLGLSAIIIGLLVDYGFKNIFLISSTLTLLIAIFLLFDKPSPPKNTEPPTNTTIIANTANNKIIWLALLCVLLVGSVVAQLCSTYPIYIEKNFFHPGMPAISILFAINAFMVVFFEAPIGNLLKDSNKVYMLGTGALLIGVGMLTLSLSHFLAIAMLASVIYTLGEIIFFSMSQLICYQRAKPGKKGHSLGMYRMVFATSRVAGPTLGALIYTNFGGDMLWLISAIFGIFCFAMCQYFKPAW